MTPTGIDSLICQLIESSGPLGLWTDPANVDVPFNELVQRFTAQGGKVYSGRFSMVFDDPKKAYVIKLFGSDDTYLQFIRWAMRQSGPIRSAFPRLLDKPRRFLPQFTREIKLDHPYAVLIERLYPITDEEWKAIEYYLYYGPTDPNDTAHLHYDSWKEIKARVAQIEKDHPGVKALYAGYQAMLNAGLDGAPDMIQSNVMKRLDGSFVLADPLWQGMTPHQINKEWMDRETDSYGDDEYRPPKVIRGGQFRKRTKVKKPALVAEPVGDDTPF